jgi:hypothetical protein
MKSHGLRWRWHKSYGWFVIDLEIPCNCYEGSNFRYIVQCSNWKVRKVDVQDARSKQDAGSGKALSPEEYFASLQQVEAEKQIKWLKAYQSDNGFSPTRRAEAKEDTLQLLRKDYLRDNNQQIGKVGSHFSQSTSRRRSTRMHCWQCKFNLDRLRNPICVDCGWYICDTCGACRCGSPYED